MIFEKIAVGNMQNRCYVFADKQSHEGIVIDPAFDHIKIMNKVKEADINITKIILTHHHYDHVNAAKAVKVQTGAKIVCHRETEVLLQGEASCDQFVDDGVLFMIGNHKVEVLHTPGHAPGAICLIISEKWLITGDTLFINDCGRGDLPGGNIEQLFDSLQRLKTLPDHLIVCPGHNYGSSESRLLGEEKRLSPALSCSTIEEFYRL